MLGTQKQKRRLIQLLLLGLLFATAACPTEQGERKATSKFESLVFRLETANWSEPYNGPLGYPKGAQKASLGIDPVSGGETYYARFPAGSRFELHWHSHSEYAVVLRGRVTHILGTESQSLAEGDYVIVPAKMNHGWKVDGSSDVFFLIRRDGPADFNFVE
jgi:mannose-6-phosphate isomerase-like protein (cupin superfamily)